ncbi:MAG: hypothetical protein PHW10_05185 [Candidatus Peribacteraceae bacterium]|nr:hypothetical protein [Candidatus Peribacteraceae bacterium]
MRKTLPLAFALLGAVAFGDVAEAKAVAVSSSRVCVRLPRLVREAKGAQLRMVLRLQKRCQTIVRASTSTTAASSDVKKTVTPPSENGTYTHVSDDGTTTVTRRSWSHVSDDGSSVQIRNSVHVESHSN